MYEFEPALGNFRDCRTAVSSGSFTFMILLLSFINIDHQLQKAFVSSHILVCNTKDNLPVDGQKALSVARSTGHVQIRKVTYYSTP
jgi:hypothetical protein